jgi:hypothetical protein
MYLSRKHDELLANTLEHGSYEKTISLVIVDGFAVEITEDQVTIYATCILFNQYLSKIHALFLSFFSYYSKQASVLRSASGVRVVEKNQELPS